MVPGVIPGLDEMLTGHIENRSEQKGYSMMSLKHIDRYNTMQIFARNGKGMCLYGGKEKGNSAAV